MTNRSRDISAALYVAAVVAGKGDARRVSNTLRDRFTKAQRQMLAEIARKALKESRS